MEHNHKENEGETLRQYASNILQKNLNLKIRSNLKKGKIRALKELQKKEIKLDFTNFVRVMDSQL